jgi:hypothetical protein
VEEIPQKLIMKALKNKIPAEQYAEMYDIKIEKKEKTRSSKKQTILKLWWLYYDS